ncbi:hypothetical protein HPP92_003842 [Vanilla planifolia]|uniref:Uncharacterized protein n=1 Tax=Vanilla planifolia TaxID=51239 RepID=A0A835VNN4_VANPL|nr:hypothetical protein HPP92_003842 [Vanilla planifolia]
MAPTKFSSSTACTCPNVFLGLLVFSTSYKLLDKKASWDSLCVDAGGRKCVSNEERLREVLRKLANGRFLGRVCCTNFAAARIGGLQPRFPNDSALQGLIRAHATRCGS